MATANDSVWFDGVDKKLLEIHSDRATNLIKAKDKSLITKSPLPDLCSYLKNKKKKRDEASKEEPARKTNGPSTSNGFHSKDELDSVVNIKPSRDITDEVALDCEMVECHFRKSVLARVSIVNLFGHPLLDSYVAPPSKVTDYRTKYSGIRKRDLDNAPDFETVQAQVKRIIDGKIVVGHAIHNDFAVLKLSHPADKTRDTSDYFKMFYQGMNPSLKKLSESILGVKIQKGEHDSVQDAQATMKLYVQVRLKWSDRLLKANKGVVQQKQVRHNNSKKQKTKPKKKKVKTFYVQT